MASLAAGIVLSIVAALGAIVFCFWGKIRAKMRGEATSATRSGYTEFNLLDEVAETSGY